MCNGHDDCLNGHDEDNCCKCIHTFTTTLPTTSQHIHVCDGGAGSVNHAQLACQSPKSVAKGGVAESGVEIHCPAQHII